MSETNRNDDPQHAVVMCELCDADERTEEQAKRNNWKYTWEGWICESCYNELQKSYATA